MALNWIAGVKCGPVSIYPVFPDIPAFVLLILVLPCLSWPKTSINFGASIKLSHLVLERQSVNMVNRVCRDCPIPNCGAKYLVKLSNHLADVHLLDPMDRRKHLQEAKLQPRVKVIVYVDSRPDKPNRQTWDQRDIFYEFSVPRKRQTAQRPKAKPSRKRGKLGKQVEQRKIKQNTTKVSATHTLRE